MCFCSFCGCKVNYSVRRQMRLGSVSVCIVMELKKLLSNGATRIYMVFHKIVFSDKVTVGVRWIVPLVCTSSVHWVDSVESHVIKFTYACTWASCTGVIKLFHHTICVTRFLNTMQIQTKRLLLEAVRGWSVGGVFQTFGYCLTQIDVRRHGELATHLIALYWRQADRQSLC